MYGIPAPHPQWRTKDLSGHVSQWDGEWFYHFRLGGYSTIEWGEIRVLAADQDALVLTELRRIHVPGHPVEGGYRIYGYVPAGTAIDYL